MIRIIIEETSEGMVQCTATTDLLGDSALKALGMLEIARMSLLAGRWGVSDGSDLQNRFPDLFAAYREGLLRSTIHAVGRGSSSASEPRQSPDCASDELKHGS